MDDPKMIDIANSISMRLSYVESTNAYTLCIPGTSDDPLIILTEDITTIKLALSIIREHQKEIRIPS